LLQAIEACAPAADAKRLLLSTDLSDTPQLCSADPGRLQQVLWNIINNAIKFSREDGQVTIRSMLDEGRVVRIAIRDFGIGMDDDTLQRLFSPFEQPSKPTQQRSGLGLGLTIAKGIVEGHGGRIWASSLGRGHGSTFEIELVALASPPAQPELHDERPASVQPNGRRVLVVEDHGDSADLLEMFLGHRGFVVSVARSIAEGIALLNQPWDVVLSDLGLPDGSGLDLARKAVQMEHRPGILIAVSGYGSHSDIDASRNAGFDHHIVKPLDFDRLLRVLNLSGVQTTPRAKKVGA
jgi:CheY-like chemotaxis protein